MYTFYRYNVYSIRTHAVFFAEPMRLRVAALGQILNRKRRKRWRYLLATQCWRQCKYNLCILCKYCRLVQTELGVQLITHTQTHPERCAVMHASSYLRMPGCLNDIHFSSILNVKCVRLFTLSPRALGVGKTGLSQVQVENAAAATTHKVLESLWAVLNVTHAELKLNGNGVLECNCITMRCRACVTKAT